MTTVSEEEFWDYFRGRWYTVHPAFYKSCVRYVIDGEVVGHRNKDENIFKIK